MLRLTIRSEAYVKATLSIGPATKPSKPTHIVLISLDIEPSLGSLPCGEPRASSSNIRNSFLRRMETVEILISSKKGKINYLYA
jgi:hypothetical protein